MLEYLGGPPEPNSLGNGFSVNNTFCLVGTAAADYPVAAGFSTRLVGQLSDGLVEIDNAIVHGPAPPNSSGGATVLAPRAYVRRAHSGPYGMVNSEEGFGNLSRFLFGDARVDGDLLVREIKLPKVLEDIKEQDDIRASYTFETALRVRGERWTMTERLARDGSGCLGFSDACPRARRTVGDGQASENPKHRYFAATTNCFRKGNSERNLPRPHR